MLYKILVGLFGLVVILAIAVGFSEDRRRIRLRVVLSAFGLQAAIAAFALYLPLGQRIIAAMANGVTWLLGFTRAGIDMMFGGLSTVNGTASFAINVLPIIIFFSCFVSILYHLGIMQWIVRGIGWMFRTLLGVSTVESFSAAANIMVGLTESPLVVRPYLRGISDSQLFAIMAGGMAAVAGAILAAYAQLGVRPEKVTV